MSDIFVPSAAPMLSWPEVAASPIVALEGPDGPVTVAMDTCLSRLPGCRNLRRLEVCVWQHAADWDATQIGSAIAYQSLLPGFDSARDRLTSVVETVTCNHRSVMCALEPFVASDNCPDLDAIVVLDQVSLFGGLPDPLFAAALRELQDGTYPLSTLVAVCPGPNAVPWRSLDWQRCFFTNLDFASLPPPHERVLWTWWSNRDRGEFETPSRAVPRSTVR